VPWRPDSPLKDALSTLIAEARKSDDLPDKAGKLLALYRPAGGTTPRVMLASVGTAAVVGPFDRDRCQRGEGVESPAWPSFCTGRGRGRCRRCRDRGGRRQLRTTTKSKAESRTIRHLSSGVADAGLRRAFDEATATVVGSNS
jgi:leucyl aminopeptidase